MKVIHLISGGDVGGAKTHVHSLLSGLGRSIEAELVCFTDGQFAEEARELGIKTSIISSGSILRDLKLLRDKIVSEGFQIIHCHGSRANMMGALLKKSTGLPTVTTVHSDYRLDYLGRPLHRLVYGTINTICLRLIDYRIGVSDPMAELLIRRGFKPERMFSIYNGLDFSYEAGGLSREDYLSSLGVSEDKDVCVFGIAARLNPVKDFPTLIRAFAEAKKSAPNIRLVIAGDGEQRGELEALASELGVSSEICFAGWVSDMDSFYRAIDVNLLTSLSETFPYALTEGVRAKCATISSRVGGVPILIDHGVNGLLFTPGDHMALAAHMTRFAADRPYRELLASRLYDKASRQFSIDATLSRQLEIYETILRRKARSAKKRDGVLICGAYGKGNSGDDAILEAILSQMRGLDPDMPLYVLSRSPKETAVRYRVRSIHSFRFLSFMSAMRKTRLYLNGGGSLIQDVTSNRSLSYYLWNIRLAKLLGNKVLMYGCGIGPVSRPSNRARAARCINKYVDAVTLRESGSQRELIDMGVYKPEIILSADPALILPPASDDKIDSLLISSGVSVRAEKICFALRPWPGFDEKAETLARCAEYAYNVHGLTPVFLPVEAGRDMSAIEKVTGRLTVPYHILPSPDSGSTAVGLMSRMRVVVSMRLHALIFAAGSGVPLIGVVYDRKVSSFLDYIGQTLYCPLAQLDERGLKLSIDEAVSMGASRERRQQAVADIRALERVNSQTARRFLGL